MPEMNGRFVWHELTTTDAAAAKGFYTDVVGWTPFEVPMPGMAYTLMLMGETRVAGMMDLPPGAKPGWTGYVGVADCDAAAKKVTSLGGKVYREPDDIPGIGRFAIVADPFGAIFALFQPGPGEPPAELPEGSPGLIGWNELYTDDLAQGFAFYEAMFGWRKDTVVPMGDMGDYQLFAAGDRVLGGMMKRPPNIPSSAWLYYFNVPDIDAGVARIKAGKGHVVNGPMEVPGGDWIAQAVDPQGIVFAIVGKRG